VSFALAYRQRARELAGVVAEVSPAEAAPDQPATSRHLLTPQLRDGFLALLRAIARRVREADADGLHRDIEPGDTSIDADMLGWRDALLADVARRRPALSNDLQFRARLDAALAHLVDAVVTAHNLAMLEADIDHLAPERGFERLGMEQRRKQVSDMTDRLLVLHRVERERLVRMIELRHDTMTERVTVSAILDLYRATWRNFGVGEDRRGLVKLTAVILVNRLMHNAAPLLWTKIFDGKSFNAEYMVVLAGLDLVDAHSSKYEAEISTSLMFVIRQRIHALAAKALFVRDLGLSDKYGSGELFDIIWKGEGAYNNIVKSLLMDGVPTLLTIPIVVGGLTVLHPLLGALGLLSIPAVYWLARTTGPRMQLAREEGVEKKRALFTRGNTMVEGIETLLAQGHLAGGRRSFLALEREGDEIDRDMISKWAKIHLYQRYPVVITGLVTALFGAYLVKQGAISPGGVITTTDYATRLRGTIVEMIHRYFEQFPREINDARSLQRLLDWSEEAAGKETDKRPVSSLASSRIECRGLAYKNIVKDLNIHAVPGEFVTISGTSGIGKTTLLRLIGGLYAPSAGEVLIGGVSLREIAPEGEDSLYTLLSISSQQPYIFDDMTLRKNLELFNPDRTLDARASEVLEAVGLAKLIPDLDKPGKRRLSGGERVRFGLARALLKVKPGRAMIVLLDEPTSALADDDGPGSTRAIRELLLTTHRENPRLTFICVTHDKKLIAVADRDIALSREEVAYIPEPMPAAEKEYVAMPGIIVDFGRE
jgi:ABC-type multidrug transport system fused ATPase/permease subunit